MLIIFAITAAAILAVIGLLYTFGLVLSQRRALQTAADAASLSGTWQVLQELASDNRSDTNVLGAVKVFAANNGVTWNATDDTAVYVDANGAPFSPSVSVGSLSGVPFRFEARGVQVKVSTQVQSVLPGFVKVLQTLVQDSATATARPTTPPASSILVLPIAVSGTLVQQALVGHTAYDLFAHNVAVGQPPTLDLRPSGAPSYGLPATNEQYWSDGQHTGAWSLPLGNVTLADGPYYDSIATGLSANVLRQGLTDASGAAYALVIVPVYDTASPPTLHIVGFAELKIRSADIKATAAPGTFVPYATAAWGTARLVAPAPDLGAALVTIVS